MKRYVFAMLAGVLLAGLPLSAQINATGTLLGTVTDKSGATVPGRGGQSDQYRNRTQPRYRDQRVR